MSGSILKEVTFTPQSFDEEYMYANSKRFRKLITILENLIDCGIIIAASNSWKKETYTFIENYSDSEKDEIVSLLKELDARNRISIYPNKGTMNSEDMWIRAIEKLNHKRPFDFSVGRVSNDIVTTIESIDRKNYLYGGAKIKKQSEENIKQIVAPILSYAEIVQIFDPYFNIDENRFFDVLEIVCKNLGNRHGIQSEAIIDIHTSIKSMLNYNKTEFVWSKANRWANKIKTLENKYHHRITLKIWEDTDKNKWHDRWMITNQCGIFMGKGSDTSNWTDATWGLLNWEELHPKILSKFVKGRGFYSFIGQITSRGIDKYQYPKNTNSTMTHEEKEKYIKKINEENLQKSGEAERIRQEKLRNVKTLKKR